MFKIGDEVWIYSFCERSSSYERTFSVVNYIGKDEVSVRGLESKFELKTGIKFYNPYLKVNKHEGNVKLIKKATKEESEQYKKEVSARLLKNLSKYK